VISFVSSFCNVKVCALAVCILILNISVGPLKVRVSQTFYVAEFKIDKISEAGVTVTDLKILLS